MNSSAFATAASIALLLTTNLYAADPWKGAQVLPKDPARLSLHGTSSRPGNEDAGNAFQIAWPARVEKIDGQWIRIGDKGDYTVPPVRGWVRKDDMLRIRDDGGATDEDPPRYISNKLLETSDTGTLAQLLWLRGIYWESQQEPQIAVQDFTAAIRTAFGQPRGVNGATESLAKLFRPEMGADAARDAQSRFGGLADAYLRLARLTAKDGSKVVAKSGNDKSSDDWKVYFACSDLLFGMQPSFAGKTNPSQTLNTADSSNVPGVSAISSTVPRLHSDWADALTAEYSRLLAERAAASKASDAGMSDAKDSHQQTVTQKKTTDAAAPATQADPIVTTADQADALYRSCAAANPTSTDAFLGRGKLFLAKANAMTAAKGDKSPPDPRPVYLQAIDQFTLAIQLDPNSREAYRRRGDAYRSLAVEKGLKKNYQERARFLSQAAQSADIACQLGKDRDPACLELLAKVIESQGEIYDDLKVPKNAATFYRQAFYYWQEAAACPNADRGRLQDLLSRCRQRATQRQMLVAESNRDIDAPERVPEIDLQFYKPGSNLLQERQRDE